jgi:hypothetical protein
MPCVRTFTSVGALRRDFASNDASREGLFLVVPLVKDLLLVGQLVGVRRSGGCSLPREPIGDRACDLIG